MLEINTYRRVEISLLNIIFNKICPREKKGWYINEVYPNGYHQYEREIHTEKSI